jgi:hypothetical protein
VYRLLAKIVFNASHTWSAKMTSDEPVGPLDRFFSGLSQYVFYSQLGVADTQLIDYISLLLIRFTRTESSLKFRTPSGQPATRIAAMWREADHRLGESRREVLQHIGDYTLFWSGLYPEALREATGKTDQFESYCAHGKRSYRIAGSMEGQTESASNELLLRLSEQFDLCAYGLREIRREWEQRDADGDSILL